MNSCSAPYPKPTAASRPVLIDQRNHTEKPMCSAKIDHTRLRRAT